MLALRFPFLCVMLVMATSLVARPIQHRFDYHLVRAGRNHTVRGSRQHPLLRRQVGENLARRDDLADHDSYESQVHKLEAALKHYDEYGDAESLQTYLNGFQGDTGSGSDSNVGRGDGDNGGGEGGSGGGDGHSAKEQGGREEKKPDQSQKGETKKPQQQQQQTQGKPPQQQPNEDDCEQDDSDHDAPRSSPVAQKSQPKMVKKPKTQQPTSQPSEPAPPHQDWTSTSPSSNTTTASTSNSINGYTPPSFATSSSPPTTALYTSPAFTGRATYYDTGLGACGITNNNHDPIVAISSDLFQQYNPQSGNPNHNSLCGRKVEINWNGKSAYAFAIDECPGCEKTSLDCSPVVFDQLDARDKGVLDGISWRFV